MRSQRWPAPDSGGPAREVRAAGAAALLVLALGSCLEPEDPVPSGPGFLPVVHSAGVDRARVRPGERLELTLRFRNLGEARADRDLRVFVHLESPSAGCCSIAWQDDHQPATPTSWWRGGEVVDLGARVLGLPEELEEGHYDLHLGLFDLEREVVVLDGPRLLLTVAQDAAPAGPVPLLTEEELERRRASWETDFEPTAVLDGSGWRYAVDARRASFRLEDLRSGAVWGTHPLHRRMGVAHLSRGDEHADAPLDSVVVGASPPDELRLELSGPAPGGGTVAVALRARPVDGGRGLSLAWSESPRDEAPEAHGGWCVEAVTLLDHAPWSTDGERGAVLTPQWLGELGRAAGASPAAWHYRSHDISMQVAAILARESALMLTWTDHGAELASRVERVDDGRVPGRTVRSLSLKLRPEDPVVELHPLGHGDHVEVAAAYRRVARRRGHLVTWGEKRALEPRVDALLGAPVMRITCAVGEVGDAHGRRVIGFDEVVALAEHWRHDLELDRLQLVLGGWNRAGYDAGHPDVLPANAACGGDEALARCIERVQALGYLVTLHDNYQDIYADSPSYEPGLLSRAEDGRPRAGGVWAGGQSWMVCPELQLVHAERNLPEVHGRFAPDAFFLDTTLTTRLQACTDPEHPLRDLEDRDHRLALFARARGLSGLLGLEGAREWAVPAAHYFEGILTHRTRSGDRFTPVPLFSLVYGDCLNLLTLQGDGLGPASAEELLDLAVLGELPVHPVASGRYWEGPARPRTEAELRDPRRTFARADRGWAAGLCLEDRFLKNCHEVLSHLHRAIGDAPMTDHRFLRGDRSAEWSRFGDVEVTINTGERPLVLGHTVLGPYGFLVRSPRFVAFHALAFGGVDYPAGACFTLRSLDGEPLERSGSVRVYHAFGDPRVRLPGAVVEVEREAVIGR